ncbi:hypothetical protein HRbin15_01303 [bacterium HR15]|nr:hypothetical protein HRbin15_01303 [bacterium HR15]
MRRIALALLGWAAMSCWADISIGGSVNKGMGGAGLAILRDPASQSYLNPAAIAYVRGFRLGMGNFDIGAQGAALDDLFDALEFRQGSGVDIDKGARLLRRFADEDTRMTLQGDFGLIVNGFGLSVGGVMDARFLPNASLRNWARTDGNPANIPNDARGDIIALAAVSLPDVTGGIRLPLQGGELAIGARMRTLRVFYTHYFADEQALRDNGSAARAPELGGRDFMERRTTGVDIGFIWKPDSTIPYTLALVVENLVEPDVRIDATDRNGNPIRLQPLRRAVHAGFAMETGTGTLFALDIIDIGNRTGRSELRFGAEQRLGPLILRSGYASRTGWTAGLGIGGFNFAYSQEFPLSVSRTLVF